MAIVRTDSSGITLGVDAAASKAGASDASKIGISPINNLPGDTEVQMALEDLALHKHLSDLLIAKQGYYLNFNNFPTTIPDTNVTLKVAQLNVGMTGDVFYLDGNSVNDHTITLLTTGAVLGSIIRIVRQVPISNTYSYSIINGGPGAGTLDTFPTFPDAFGELADFLFDGTNWAFNGSNGWLAGFIIA